VSAPDAVDATDALRQVLTDQLVLHADTGGVVIVLTPGWVALLSEAMLGQPMDPTDVGAADLMQEVAAQGFGAVQSALADEGLTLPSVQFAAATPSESGPQVSGSMHKITFATEHDGAQLDGFVLVPTSADADSTEPSTAEAQGTSGGTSAADAPSAQAAAAGEPSASRAASSGAPSGGSHGDAGASSEGGVDVAPASFSDLGRENIGGDGGGPNNFQLLAEVKLEVTVELGRRRLPLADVLKLTTGSVVELEKLVGEPLSVYANGRLIAEGEAVVIDEQFGVRITSLASETQRDKAFF